MQATEHSKENPCNQCQGNGKDKCEELIYQILAELKESMAADPDFIEGVSGCRLRYHVLKPQLEQRETSMSTANTASLLKCRVGSSPGGKAPGNRQQE